MNTEIQTTGRDRLRALMSGIQDQIAEVLPRHLDAETMTRIVLVEGSRNPDLRRCTSESLAGSIMLASQLGLTPSSPLGHFYLVPRRETDRASRAKVWRCGFVIGYRGFVELARRAGLRINAGVVYQSEAKAGSFRFTIEPPTLEHDGALGIDRSDQSLVAAYAVAEHTTAAGVVQRWQLVLDRAELDAARRQAGTDRIWGEHFAAMSRKTAIRRLLNGGLVPLNSELQQAIEAENEQDSKAADVIEADQVDATPRPAPVDPLRAALALPTAPGEGLPTALERAIELEGILDLPAVNEAAKAAGIGDRPLSDCTEAEIDRYVAEMGARQ